MAKPTKFEFARPVTPRVTDIVYVSQPLLPEVPVSSSGSGVQSPSIL